MRNFLEIKILKEKDIEINCKYLISRISKLLSLGEFNLWISEISKILQFDKKKTIFFIKKKIFETYSFSKNSFSKKLKLYYLPTYFIYLNFILIKKLLSPKPKFICSYDLIIDNISSNFELSSYQDILKYISSKKILVRTTNKNVNSKKFNTVNFKHSYIRLREYLKIIRFSIFTIILSLRFKINLLYLLVKLLDDYLFFRSFFNFYKSKNIIMHQHYLSNNIKNHFFKKNGGKKSCLIQKNINTRNTNGYFYDADLVFGFSKNTRINKNETFSRINNFQDIGSFFLNRNLNKIKKNKKFNFDILYLGGNDLGPSGYYDTYNNYKADYLNQLDWLKKFSLENKNLKIAFKHHSNNEFNFEKEYLRDSGVIFLNQKLNSYEIAYNSKMIVSWASTMIVEISSLNKFCYFLNPKGRNKQFLKDIINSSDLSIRNYKSLVEKYKFAKKNKFFKKNNNKYCKIDRKYFYNIVKNLA